MKFDIKHIADIPNKLPEIVFYEKDTNNIVSTKLFFRTIIEDNIFDKIVNIELIDDNRKYIFTIQTEFYGKFTILVKVNHTSFDDIEATINYLLEQIKRYKKVVNRDYYIFDTKSNEMTHVIKSEDEELKKEIQNIKNQMKQFSKFFREATAIE